MIKRFHFKTKLKLNSGINQMKSIFASFVFLALMLSTVAAFAQDSQEHHQWKLKTLDGSSVQPFADQATKAMVLVFVTTDCPIANAYHPKLAEMYQKYQTKGIRFYLVHSSKEINKQAGQKHVEEYRLQIPVVLDKDQSIARRVGATVTPEVVVISGSNDDPLYQGRIDNLYENYGKKRQAATRHYLKDALDQLLAGKEIQTRSTKPIGCFISFDEEEPISIKVVTKNKFVSQVAANTTQDYDPLKTGSQKVNTLDFDIEDKERDRKIPIKVYQAVSSSQEDTGLPVILFSHGLGGSRNNNKYLGEQWSKRGYIVVFVQHPGSDESVWKDTALRERMNAMRKAANAENFQLRAADIPAVIDQLEKWNKEKEHQLFDKMDLSKIGMSGHSFGALTTQAVSGQVYLRQPRFQEKRIKASVAFSPSAPRAGSADAAFESIKIPFMCMTGTKDTSPIGNATVESRLQVYKSLPNVNKYQLVLKDGEHSAFSERRLPGDRMQRNPNHHKLIKALSTAFWDAYLKEAPNAKEWLTSSKPKDLLEKGDQWSVK